MKNFLKREHLEKYLPLILIEILVISVFTIFYGHFGDIIVDSFREAYIPQQILNKEALYKNIFCIYPPFAYLFNSTLFAIFGIHLKVLYFAGLFTTLGIFYYFYKISKTFLNTYQTFSICLISIAGLVLSPNVFNSFFPYSYGMLYGTFFTICAIYYGIKSKFIPAYILCALAICSKIEFITILPVLIYFSGRKNILKNLLAFLLPPILLVTVLLLQGVKISDLILSFDIIKEISNAKTLGYFYSKMGLVFHWEHFEYYLRNIFKFFIPIKISPFQETIMWIFPAITCLFIYKFKNLNTTERFIIFATICIGLKVYWALSMQSYGVYHIPLACLCLLILCSEKKHFYFKNFSINFRTILATYFILWSIIIGYFNTTALQNKTCKISTCKGTIYTQEKTGVYINDIIKTLTINDNKTTMVLPEGLVINFLTNNPSDSKFYSLIPLYTEIFDDDLIIQRIKFKKPDCIIITDYNTSSYGFEQFGIDYSKKVYYWIKSNYRLKTKKNNYEIYEK